MPLFIRDERVDALADELKEALNAPSKKEAVRRALINELRRIRAATPFASRIARAHALADSMGTGDPSFDMKTFSDELSGEE